MNWVKQSIHYWCPDTKEHKFLGQNVTVAILDTGISPHPDFKGRILSFRDLSNTTGSSEKVLFSYFEDIFSRYSVQIWAATSTILAHGRLA